MSLKWKIRNTLHRVRPGNPSQLDYIHIGKCGGTSVKAAIYDNPFVTDRFDTIFHTHVVKPTYKRGTRYLFVVRNPIDRALSAFNWRQKLVIEDGKQHGRFAGEAEALRRHDTLEDLALALYDGDRPNAQAAADFRAIHHLKEDIAHYLEGFAEAIAPEQIFAVLCQGTLDEDIEAQLKVPSPPRARSHREHTDRRRLELSVTARRNLARFLERDYELLRQLDAFFPLGEKRMADLMRV